MHIIPDTKSDKNEDKKYLGFNDSGYSFCGYRACGSFCCAYETKLIEKSKKA